MKASDLRIGDVLRSQNTIVDDETITELQICSHAVAVATRRWERIYGKDDDVAAYRPDQTEPASCV